MDTVGFLAVWNKSDQWHGDAATAFERINQPETTLLTTSFVLLECGNAAARNSLRDEVDLVRQQFELAGTLIWPTAKGLERRLVCLPAERSRFSGDRGSELVCRYAPVGTDRSLHQ